jgi:Fibrobacter succinogenes major domain (Fib_succ_major).
MVIALAALTLAGCIDESSLYEKINPDALRKTNVFQLKKSGKKVCKYKVAIEGVIMGADNMDANTYAFQDGEEAQDGILLRTSGSFSFGEKVSVYLEGMELSKEGDVFVMTDPDGTRVTSISKSSAFSPISVNASKLASGTFQSQYVSMEGWQVIEEDLDKSYSSGVRIENVEKDTVLVKVVSRASFANNQVAQGSGKISGIVGQENGQYVIMPQAADDVEFTDDRFMIGDPNYAILAWAEGSKLNGFISEVSSNPIDGAVKYLPGAANCFVVSAPGIYFFDAKNADGMYPAGIPDGAQIYFNVTALGGTTVVAYLDPEDGKTVLWTWTIWASNASLESMAVTRETAAADDGVKRKVVVLDRLLGATTTTPGEVGANGLVYQWGRKDPIPGPSIRGAWSSSGDNEIPSGSDIWSDMSFDATAKTTVNPDFFPSFNYMNGTDLGEITESAQGGSAYATTFIGNSSSSTITGYPSAADTIWMKVADPCPAGWHVPNQNEAKAILGVSASYTSDEYTTHADGTTPGMDMTTNLGTKIKGCSIWFPNNGNRARKNARYLNLGSRSYAWLTTKSSASGHVMSIQNTGKGTVVNPANSFNRGNATGVRCVKDNSYEEEGVVKEDNLAAIVWSEGSSLTGFVSEVSTVKIDGAKHLEGNGNCFVVSAPGTYCFDAKNAAGAYPEGVKEGTEIYVKVAKVGGNAVVCCLDNLTDKNITWTWHIWCSAKSIDEMSVTRSTLKVFDRYIGANSITPGDPASNGLYFQWGRKDAFPGPCIKGDYAEDKEAQSEDALGGVATATTTVNAELGVAAWNVNADATAPSAKAGTAIPTTFLATSTWADTPGGEAGVWPAEGNPCPAGWRVPTVDEAKLILGVEADTEFSGMDMENLCSSYEGMFFPNNGDRARKNGRLLSLGRRSFSWLSTTNGNSGYTITVSSSKLMPAGSFNRGNATGVRCVK